MRGKVLGVVVILLAVVLLAFSLRYTAQLEQQRTQAIAQLVSLPQYAECRYDETTCPQAENNVVLPDVTGVALVILGILLGFYLIRSDKTQRSILDELSTKRKQLSTDEQKQLILSVLTNDERKIVRAVEKQPGISQATLSLRVDMSKAKLSSLLKELENRKLIKRTMKGKTNAVRLRQEW